MILVAIIPSCPQSPAEYKAESGDLQDRAAAGLETGQAPSPICAEELVGPEAAKRLGWDSRQ